MHLSMAILIPQPKNPLLFSVPANAYMAYSEISDTVQQAFQQRYLRVPATSLSSAQ